ncbi:Alpha carbonic anhydrase 7, partial [Zea mays]
IPNQFSFQKGKAEPASGEATEGYGSPPRPHRRAAPRGGLPALRCRPGRQSPGRNRARGGVQLRRRRRERAGALGQHQGGVGQLQRRADAVPHRPLPRARLAGAVPRLPHPLLPPRRGRHRQPRPRHHGEVQGRRRLPGDQRHGVLPEADALALAHRAHRRRPQVRTNEWWSAGLVVVVESQ